MSSKKQRARKKRLEMQIGGLVAFLLGVPLALLLRQFTDETTSIAVYQYVGATASLSLLGLVLFIASFFVKER